MSEYWHIADASGRRGPLAAEEVRAELAERIISATALVWKPGMQDWEPVSVHFDGVEPAVDCVPAKPQAVNSTGAWALSSGVARIVASAALLVCAWMAQKVGPPPTDLETPNLVVGAYITRALLSGLFASASALLWLPLALRRARENAPTARLGLALIVLLSFAGLAFAGVELRQTSIVREIATANARLPAAKVGVGPDGAILYDGQIGYGSYVRLRAALDAHPDAHEVVLQSNGGVVSEALRLAHLVEERRLNTRVETYCHSACVAVLLAGAHRSTDLLADVAFHAIRAEFTADPAIKRLVVETSDTEMTSYLSSHGVSNDVISETRQLGPSRLNRKSSVYLLKSGLLNEITFKGRSLPLDAAEWQYVEEKSKLAAHGAGLANLLSAIRASDADAVRQHASTVYRAYVADDGNGLKAAVAGIVKPAVERASRAASPAFFDRYLRVQVAQAEYLAKRGDWVNCAAYSFGTGTASGLSQELLDEELRSKADLVRDAAANRWEPQVAPSQDDAAAAYQVADAYARPYGVNVATQQTGSKEKCIDALSILAGLRSLGPGRGQAAYLWFLAQST